MFVTYKTDAEAEKAVGDSEKPDGVRGFIRETK